MMAVENSQGHRHFT